MVKTIANNHDTSSFGALIFRIVEYPNGNHTRDSRNLDDE